MAIKGDELVQYITEKVVHYVDTPKDEREEKRRAREPWTVRWFGMIPMSIGMWLGRSNKEKKRRSNKAI